MTFIRPGKKLRVLVSQANDVVWYIGRMIDRFIVYKTRVAEKKVEVAEREKSLPR